jgi:uncharacterized protein DUF3710
VIFRRDRKRKRSAEDDPNSELEDATTEASDDGADRPVDEEDLAALDALEWRGEGPWDVSEMDDLEAIEERQRIDLGSLIITGVPGSELRLQVAEETKEIVSAMMVIESTVPAPGGKTGSTQKVSSALELGAYAAPRSGGLWAELRDEISEAATAQGGSASLREGPFGVELYRFIPVTTPEGEQGYQPSRMWVAEGPRWLLRGIVYGQAAVEDDVESPVVANVLAAFRQVIVRRGEEAMAPGDLLPLSMPSTVTAGGEPG